MTLRDYFAAKSIVLFINDPVVMQTAKITNKTIRDVVAELSYGMADAMLKAREAK